MPSGSGEIFRCKLNDALTNDPCDYETTMAYFLDNHLDQKHFKNQLDQLLPDPKHLPSKWSKHHCPECPEKFKRFTQLRTHFSSEHGYRYGILLPKLFWPTVGKNCSSDREKNMKFEAEGREFAKNLRSLEQFILKVKGQNNFWWHNAFLPCS